MATRDSAHEEGGSHIVGYGQFVLVWLSLVSLTVITVALAGIDLGRWVIVTALTIAAIKSTLVGRVFMHLKFESRVFTLFVMIALITLAIFLSLTFFDYSFRG